MIRFLYGRPLETLLATWGISLMLQQAVRSIFGAQNVGVENPVWMSGGVQVLGSLAEILLTIRLAGSVNRLAGNLSHRQKQWLEIGMLLMQDPKLLLLDEPVAGMTDEETARTAELFLTLKGRHSLIVVEHDMSFIRKISGIVTVLCDGAVLAQGTLNQA